MSVVLKTINGKEYAYLAFRSGRKVVQRYIGPMSSAATKSRLGSIASQKVVPQKYSWLFWDTEPAKIDLKVNGRYVIERVLETGGFEEFSWIQRVYPTRLIIETCEISRKISHKSKNFWRIWFDEGLR